MLDLCFYCRLDIFLFNFINKYVKRKTKIFFVEYKQDCFRYRYSLTCSQASGSFIVKILYKKIKENINNLPKMGRFTDIFPICDDKKDNLSLMQCLNETLLCRN